MRRFRIQLTDNVRQIIEAENALEAAKIAINKTYHPEGLCLMKNRAGIIPRDESEMTSSTHPKKYKAIVEFGYRSRCEFYIFELDEKGRTIAPYVRSPWECKHFPAEEWPIFRTRRKWINHQD